MSDSSGYGQGQPQQPQQQPYPYDPSASGFPQQPGYGAQPGQPIQPGGPIQPGYGGEHGGYPQPLAPKKTNGALIATVVAAVLVVGGGIAAAVVLTGKSNNPSPVADQSSRPPVATSGATGGASPSSASTSTGSGSLSIPASVSGMKLLDDSESKSAVSSMSTSLAGDKDLYPDPVIAAYNDGGGDNVTELFENQAIADLDSSTQSEFTSYDPSTVVSQLMTGAQISNAEDESTTASNGALSCGSRTVNSIDVVFCFWDDTTSFGGLEFFTSTSLSDDAAKADAIRAASEGS
ncbi:hypothetical protein KDL01_23655 [Actinospica durhamensis]|uniref:Uncharacterized protein n=1 Tax=Actinospica durhamensis TaxID=1508375 RepID=A0A941IQK2_9ACTN|nr:hypothetical protein [Actinospica durhamensis]MBR7836294.1 hypothetical protein [Actinospica durhamensis]